MSVCTSLKHLFCFGVFLILPTTVEDCASYTLQGTTTTRTWTTGFRSQTAHHTQSGSFLDSTTNAHLCFFHFSKFYVFYEQYLYIEMQAILNLSICLATVFGVTLILLGLDIWTSLIILLTIALILLSMIGEMYLWDINLNALSLVNLIMVGWGQVTEAWGRVRWREWEKEGGGGRKRGRESPKSELRLKLFHASNLRAVEFHRFLSSDLL